VPAALRGPQTPSTLCSLAAAFAMPRRIHDHYVFEAVALSVEADVGTFKPHELAEVRRRSRKSALPTVENL
jgi:hypothetical protein